MKAAVYCGTRNVYWTMTPAAKSLLKHSDVERIYFLIEDDSFPEPLPEIFTCINVSRQRWIRADGPNAGRRWTWMSLVRAALPKLLPELDTVLNLDNDTIVVSDISDLWDLNLGKNFFAGVREPGKSIEHDYINYGVTLHNLKLLRETGMCDSLILALNTKRYDCPMQDSLYELCGGRVLLLDGAYNVTDYTERSTEVPRIVHYAAVPCWERRALVETYRKMSWSEVRP